MEKITAGYILAFIRSKVIKGKKYFYIVWHDSVQRREVSCKKYGAKNGEQRKELLKQFQTKENEIIFQIENKLFKPKQEELNISDLADKYLENMRELHEVRKVNKTQGISKSHLCLIEYSIRRLLEFLMEHKIV
ncbi:MAG: hypothetical protein K8S87_04265, partial [Planctomycetes bacterium]|nr:hypothetical protein [Planctomycetota bacterium]